MFHLQGFMVINSLIDNALKNQIAKLGELSPLARTYTREPGIYADDDYDGVRLYTFYSQKDEDKIVLETKHAKSVLRIGHWMMQQSLKLAINSERNTFRQALQAEFASDIKVINVGKMLSDEKYWLPEYITFSLLTDERENQYKIWFADESFRNQYDKFEIEVITPLLVLDDFFKSSTVVKEKITEHTVVNLHTEVNEKMNKLPYTALKSFLYDYVDPDDATNKIKTPWTVLLYGNAANNADVIRQAIIDYVLANSDYTRDQWEKILPDLFIPTEFYICPFWTKFATPNLQLQGGVHSPIIPMREILPWAKRNMIGFKDDHITNYVVATTAIFKSVGLIICGHPQNRLLPIEFEKAWPEYINVYTTSRDFNRVSASTQDFIMLLNSLLVEAESMTPDSSIPEVSATLGGRGKMITGYTRVRRGDMYYITASMNNVTYLVPLRYNYLAEIQLSQTSSVTTPVVATAGSAATTDEVVRNVVDLKTSIQTSSVAGSETNTVENTRPNGLTGTQPDNDNRNTASINGNGSNS